MKKKLNLLIRVFIEVIVVDSRLNHLHSKSHFITYDTHEKALEFLDIFNPEEWIDDEYIYINLEILDLYKSSKSSEILKTVNEMKKLGEFSLELEDEEYILLNKKNNLNDLLVEIDKKQKVLQDMIKECKEKKEMILTEKITLEKELNSVTQNILDIETQKKDLLNNIKLLEW